MYGMYSQYQTINIGIGTFIIVIGIGIRYSFFTLFDDDIHYYFSNSFIIGIGIVISIGDSIGIGNSISDWYY